MPVEIIGEQPQAISTILLPQGVFWTDDFEGAFNWVKSGGPGTDWRVGIDSSKSFQKAASMEIQTQATNPASGNWARAQHYIFNPLARMVKWAWKMHLNGSLQFNPIKFFIRHHTQLKSYGVGLNFYTGITKITYIYGADGVAETLSTTHRINPDAWHHVEIIYSIPNKKLYSIIIDDTIFRLNINLRELTAQEMPQVDMEIKITTRTAEQRTLHVDNIELVETKEE